MTIGNIMAGFKVTGVFPLDRYALIPTESAEKQSLCERTGLQYIPFYTPRKSRRITLPSTPTEPTDMVEEQVSPSHCCNDSTRPFTAEELACFQKRFEEEYDLKTDERYNCWLLTRDIVLPKPNTSITPFLELPMVKFPDTSEHKPSGRVITSVDFRRQLMEKQKKKEEALKMKAFRMAERERKQFEKQKKIGAVFKERYVHFIRVHEMC